MQQTKAEKINKGTIVNLIQHLPHTLLCKCKGNDKRGRSQIKFGMTPLYNKGAFTLIELLVVVLIIGVLAAVALPQYNKAIARAQFTQTLQMIGTYMKALDMYMLEYGLPNQNDRMYFTGTSGLNNAEMLNINLAFDTCDTVSSCTSKFADWSIFCDKDMCEMNVHNLKPQNPSLNGLLIRKNGPSDNWYWGGGSWNQNKKPNTLLKLWYETVKDGFVELRYSSYATACSKVGVDF